MTQKLFFTKKLLEWYEPNHRPLPWKGIKNPYFIWLSEIILQQTRVEQGLPYYLKFIQKYPEINALAKAPEDEILKLWEGLGYYSRARNLHTAAKEIVANHKGIFPKKFEEILKLKGVGDYTASAIASFAYDLPRAVIDGNVYRVLTRFFGVYTPVDTSKGKKEIHLLADCLLDTKQPALYNQAIMDFGATQCTPNAPDCSGCILKTDCTAYAMKKVRTFPVKSKKIKKRKRYFYYLVLKQKGKLLLRKRKDKDIWAGLYDFPLIELNNQVDKARVEETLQDSPEWNYWLKDKDTTTLSVSEIFRQTLTHQNISAIFLEFEYNSDLILKKENYITVPINALKNYAFPQIINQFLKSKNS